MIVAAQSRYTGMLAVEQCPCERGHIGASSSRTKDWSCDHASPLSNVRLAEFRFQPTEWLAKSVIVPLPQASKQARLGLGHLT